MDVTYASQIIYLGIVFKIFYQTKFHGVTIVGENGMSFGFAMPM
jgi:hypothetical protein